MTQLVKFFDSTMTGAPQLLNAWGAMTEVLDAVLINGFNLKPVTSLTRVNDLVVAQCAGHGYRVGSAVRIEGALPNAYNGDFVVTAITSDSFSYVITDTPATPATGTISAKVAPLGWEIAFTGNNKRAYRSRNVQSNRPFLRVDDSLDPLYTTTFAKYAKVTMAQGMSDIDTFVGARAPFYPAAPTMNEVATGSGADVVNGAHKWYFAKSLGNPDSAAPNSEIRSWCIVGDDRGFYLFNESQARMSGLGGKCFTDFESFRAGDGFNTLLCASDWNFSASMFPYSVDPEGMSSADYRSRFVRTLDGYGKVLMRPHTQVGASVNAGFTSLNTNNGQTVSGRNTGISWPNGPDYGLILHPVALRETTHIRGRMPGMMWVHNDSPDLPHLSFVEGVAGYPGRRFLVVKLSHGTANDYGSTTLAMLLFDITGPWR